MEKEPIKECPRCVDEKLIKTVGNLLVCPNCDLILIDVKKRED